MKVYIFVRGVDGFGEDISPAFEEGIYTNYETAFKKQLKLNENADLDNLFFFEDGYGEDYYPANNIILTKAEEEKDWDTFDEEIEKHRITDLSTVCKKINENANESVPFRMYGIVECELIED